MEEDDENVRESYNCKKNDGKNERKEKIELLGTWSGLKRFNKEVDSFGY